MSDGGIFISHSHHDREIAQRLADDLMNQNFRVWLDRFEIEPTEDWSTEIEKGIDDASVVVVVWTENARDSQKWVRREIARADEQNKIIVTLLFDNTEVDIRIQRAQRIDFRKGWFENIQELFVFLETMVRQQEELVGLTEPPWKMVREPNQRNRFLYENHYSISVNSGDFGQNEWTNRLRFPVETDEAFRWDWNPANHFVTVVYVPIDTAPVAVNFHDLTLYLGRLDKPNTGTIQRPHDAPECRRFPYSSFRFERHENNDYVRYDPVSSKRGTGGTEVSRFLRISQDGAIEFAESHYLVHSLKDAPTAFNYIGLLGLTWQIVFFAEQIYREILHYSGRTELLVNLVGTSDGVLAEYAEGWESPFQRIRQRFHFPEEIERLKCLTRNIRIVYQIDWRFYDQAQYSKSLIENLGQELQRCFNEPELRDYYYSYNTKEFPWRQYYRSAWSR